MIPDDEAIRVLIQQTFGGALRTDEIDRLIPLVQRQYQVSDQLAARDLGGLHPDDTDFITDHRVSR